MKNILINIIPSDNAKKDGYSFLHSYTIRIRCLNCIYYDTNSIAPSLMSHLDESLFCKCSKVILRIT